MEVHHGIANGWIQAGGLSELNLSKCQTLSKERRLARRLGAIVEVRLRAKRQPAQQAVRVQQKLLRELAQDQAAQLRGAGDAVQACDVHATAVADGKVSKRRQVA